MTHHQQSLHMEVTRMGTPSVAVAQNSSAAAHVCFVGQAGPTGLVMCLRGGQCAEQNNVVTTFRSFEQLSRCGLHRVIRYVPRGRRPVNHRWCGSRSSRECSGSQNSFAQYFGACLKRCSMDKRVITHSRRIGLPLRSCNML